MFTEKVLSFALLSNENLGMKTDLLPEYHCWWLGTYNEPKNRFACNFSFERVRNLKDFSQHDFTLLGLFFFCLLFF